MRTCPCLSFLQCPPEQVSLNQNTDTNNTSLKINFCTFGSPRTFSVGGAAEFAYYYYTRPPEHSHRCAGSPHHRSISPTWAHGLRNTLRFFKFSFSVCRPVSEDGRHGPSVVLLQFYSDKYISYVPLVCYCNSWMRSELQWSICAW